MDINRLIQELRANDAATELADELQDLIRKVVETGKGGSISLTLSVKPAGGGRVWVEDAIVSRPPKPVKESTLFFILDDYSLSRKSPHQVAMSLVDDIKEIDTP